MRIALSLAVMLVLGACVPKSAYQALENEKVRLEHELQLERAGRETFRAQSNLRQLKAVQALEVKLAACEARVVVTQQAGERLAQETARTGYYKAIAELHRSIQITGLSYSSGWWIFADNYYTIDVSVAGHSLFRQELKTTNQEDNVQKALGTLTVLRELLPYRARL